MQIIIIFLWILAFPSPFSGELSAKYARKQGEGNPAIVLLLPFNSYHTSCWCFSLITSVENAPHAGWCNQFMPHILPSSSLDCWWRLTRSETRSCTERDGAKEEVEDVGCKALKLKEEEEEEKKKKPRVCVCERNDIRSDGCRRGQIKRSSRLVEPLSSAQTFSALPFILPSVHKRSECMWGVFFVCVLHERTFQRLW